MTSRNNKISRKVAAVAFSALTVAGMSTGAASAQTAPVGSIQAPSQTDVNNWVLQQHDNLYNQANGLPEQFRAPVQGAIDNATNFIAPGALEARAAEVARQEAAARAEAARVAAEREAAERAASTANTPCPAWARACVDLRGHRSWLQNNGQVTYGPTPSIAGGVGQETPTGTFTIQYKVKDEISREFNNAPMPYSVYFTNSGHAFHEGSTAITSAGCVHLNSEAAPIFFNTLNPGDKIFIY